MKAKILKLILVLFKFPDVPSFLRKQESRKTAGIFKQDKYISYLKKLPLKMLAKISYKGQTGVAGLWESESEFLKAVQFIYQNEKLEPITITPYPVHGLEEKTNTPRSWIPWVALVCGVSGCLFGLWFTWWTSAVNWPIIVGGKPFWSLPAFIPIVFELTILFSALGSIVALFYACGLPSIDPPVIDKDLTCHKFAVFFTKKHCSKEKATALLQELKAPQIKESEF